MPEIYVDADGCPVRDEILRVAERHGLVTHLVSDGGGIEKAAQARRRAWMAVSRA